MSTLTGQQIKDTYDGLLKLEDSTNGITANLQPIQDGLGNNTGSRIATNYLTAPNVFSVDNNLKPDYCGIGFSTGAGTAMSAGSQNRVLYCPFYDPGVFSYSAITYNLGTLTTTSDVVTFAFYSLQTVPIYGMAPKNLIMSGITLLSTGTTGVKTTTLPSTLSFSGTGGGWYVAAAYFANANVTPTVRYTQTTFPVMNQSYFMGPWFYLANTGQATFLGHRQQTITFQIGFPLNNLQFQTSYSEQDIVNNVGNPLSSFPGFALNVMR